MIDRLQRRQRSFFLLLAVMLVIGFLAFEFASSAEVALAILLILEEVPLIMLWVFITAPRLHLQVQDQFVSLLDDELDPWQARQRLKQERLEDLLDAQNMLSLCDLLEGTSGNRSSAEGAVSAHAEIAADTAAAESERHASACRTEQRGQGQLAAGTAAALCM